MVLYYSMCFKKSKIKIEIDFSFYRNFFVHSHQTSCKKILPTSYKETNGVPATWAAYLGQIWLPMAGHDSR